MEYYEGELMNGFEAMRKAKLDSSLEIRGPGEGSWLTFSERGDWNFTCHYLSSENWDVRKRIPAKLERCITRIKVWMANKHNLVDEDKELRHILSSYIEGK